MSEITSKDFHVICKWFIVKSELSEPNGDDIEALIMLYESMTPEQQENSKELYSHILNSNKN